MKKNTGRKKSIKSIGRSFNIVKLYLVKLIRLLRNYFISKPNIDNKRNIYVNIINENIINEKYFKFLNLKISTKCYYHYLLFRLKN